MFMGQDISQELVDEIAQKSTFSSIKKVSSAKYEWLDKVYEA